MQPNDFVFLQIYRGAIKAGAKERAAKDHAIMGSEDFRRNSFKKASHLIEERIKAAKRESK